MFQMMGVFAEFERSIYPGHHRVPAILESSKNRREKVLQISRNLLNHLDAKTWSFAAKCLIRIK